MYSLQRLLEGDFKKIKTRHEMIEGTSENS